MEEKMNRSKVVWFAAGCALVGLLLALPGLTLSASGADDNDNQAGVQVNVQVSHEGSNTIPSTRDKERKERSSSDQKGGVYVRRSADWTDQTKSQSRHSIFQYMPDSSKSYGTESMLSEISQEVAGKVFYELKEEGQKNLTSRVAVVAAVPLSDLKRETEFGRVIAEYYLTDLADRGLKVKELRLGKDINILPQTGEFILSRNIGELANNSPALDYVVVSTFTNTRKTLILQGRLISLQTGLVKSSWRYNLPLNRELLGLFYSTDQPFTIAVKGMGQ